ncbi:MAG: sulfatase family protein [Solirubrobacterales bacterium]
MATAAVTAALALAGRADQPSMGRAAVSPDAPNVLVIETDDQTVESMKMMQNVNSLIGAQGATFTNSFVNYSLCCPSRATFLTGQYAHNHKVWSNTPPSGGFSRFESLHASNNLAVWLSSAGYYTAMIGKYLNKYENQPPIPPGWTEWHAVAPDDQTVYDYTLNNNGVLTHYGDTAWDYKQDVLTRKAVNFVDRRARKPRPFFLWLTYTAPHVGLPNPSPLPPSDCRGTAKPASRDAHAFDSEPLPMPPSFNEADVSDKPPAVRKLPLLDDAQIADIQRRYRCELESLRSVDDGVKQVIDALAAKDDLDNTLIIYTSDNGYFHGEHRIPVGKTRIYEESIRVPLEMRGPGIPQGVSLNPPVINADLAPTIVDAADVTPGLDMDGHSLLPVIQHPATDRNRDLLIEEPDVKAIRTPRYLYAEYGHGEQELYDLLHDPYELQSLDKSAAYASVKSTLRFRLHQLEGCAGPSCVMHKPDPPAP